MAHDDPGHDPGAARRRARAVHPGPASLSEERVGSSSDPRGGPGGTQCRPVARGGRPPTPSRHGVPVERRGSPGAVPDRSHARVAGRDHCRDGGVPDRQEPLSAERLGGPCPRADHGPVSVPGRPAELPDRRQLLALCRGRSARCPCDPDGAGRSPVGGVEQDEFRRPVHGRPSGAQHHRQGSREPVAHARRRDRP